MLVAGVGMYALERYVTLGPRAQEWQDSDEMVVEPVAMPAVLLATIRNFCETHYRDVPFVKRKRDRKRIDLIEDGIGDERIRQTADVYRSPSSQKARLADE